METKKEFRIFTIVNHKEEEQYLRKMHNQGWKFVKVTDIGTYHFERCQPEDVVYQLDFNQDSAADREGYVGMFSDCGWDYIQDFFGFSYFRKSAAQMNGEEEIFSDDSSRIAMMERIFKGRMIPLLVIFAALLVPQFVINLNEGRVAVAVVYGTFLLAYVWIFVYFGVNYHRQKK